VPSLPEIVTCVAFTAETVRIEELPAVIEVGFALICTAGAALVVTVTVTLAVTLLPPESDAVAV
jgi:hypothetical protein